MSRLITPTLVNSIKWLKNCPPTWRGKARDDLENMLKRIWTEAGPAIKHGIEFEKKVYANMKIEDCPGSDEFKKVVNLCQGGEVQKVIKKIIEVDGNEYCLYGKSDVMKDDYIIDIKTTAKFKEKTYIDSFQHVQYMYTANMPKFQYIIAEWSEYPKIKEVHVINIETMKMSIYEKKVVSTIKDTIDFLSQENYMDLYLDKFCLKK